MAQLWDEFDKCQFRPAVNQALLALGFEKPTHIQARCWPTITSGRDVIGVSATGSGKTLAFLAPAVNLLMQLPFGRRSAGAACPGLLILAPTRELADQIHEEGSRLTRNIKMKIRSAVIYGGVDSQVQRKYLSEGVHWCVGTPGRLLDFLGRKHLSLEKLAVVVLDEADRMLDQGFEADLRSIMSYRPPKLQSLLFTATWDPSAKVQALANDFLVEPEVIQTSNGSKAPNPKIEHQFYICRTDQEKLLRLVQQIDQLVDEQKLIVFVNTKVGCLEVQSSLTRFRKPCFVLQGDMDQVSREASLAAFKNCNPGVLVATDVAARGLDIENVMVVFNYDMPTTSDTFVHRVGRTGRAEKHGIAVTLLSPLEKREQQVAREVAEYLAASEDSFSELIAFLEDDVASTFSGRTAGGYTHNTGLTRPAVELEGHQLARVLASDRLIVEETLRRGLRFLNIERSKALDDRFRAPKWKFRRLVSLTELKDAAKRHDKGEEALAVLSNDGESMLGIVHAMVTDLYDPTQYVATEMFELPHIGDHMWAIFDQMAEMLVEADDVEFAEQVTGNAAFQEALRAQWLAGDTKEEYYWRTFSKLSFRHFNNKPLLHRLCEDGAFVETLRFLLNGFSHQTAEQPWLRLVDVEEREKQYGNTAFHICAYAGYVDFLQELVNHAKKYEIPVKLLKSSTGETVLDVASARNNRDCFNILASFFDVQPSDEDADTETLAQRVLVVDGHQDSSGQAPRVSCSLPDALSLRDLAARLQELLEQLNCQPNLIYLKKVHLCSDGSTSEDAEAFLKLTTPAASLTAYRCTADSLDVCTNILQACVRSFTGDPAWERFFFIPRVQGDPTLEERERFTTITLEMVDTLKVRAKQAKLRLHSFGRDGSAKFSYPRAYLTNSSLVEIVQGLFHVNSFLHIRRKLEEKLESQKSTAKFSRRSKQGRNAVSEDDVKMLYFFTAKLSFIDRFCYDRDQVDSDMAETSPVDGLRAGVDVERAVTVVAEWLGFWAYPLIGPMPRDLERVFPEYLAALDNGLWCLLQHHRLLPGVRQVVQEMLDTLPDIRSLSRTMTWMKDHDKTQIIQS